MVRLGNIISSDSNDEDYLDTQICPFRKWKDATWRQVIETDPGYVDFILHNTDLDLPKKLVEYLELELDDLPVDY